MSPPPYDPDYFDALDGPARSSAAVVARLVADLVRPGSVVDVGCGSGAWLAAFAALGAEVVGVDGPWLAGEGARPFPGPFVACDFEVSVPDLGRRFDLAVSLEVAEHLSDDRAAPFVAGLTSLSDVVLFSAAVPGQGGRDHRNERWPSYWADRFSAHGYLAVDVVRLRVWDRPEVAWWYRQNTLLFLTEAALERLDLGQHVAAPPLSLVHPDRFEWVLRELDASRAEGAELRTRNDGLVEWGMDLDRETVGLRREVARLRAFDPGVVSLRSVLRASPKLALHALQRRASRLAGRLRPERQAGPEVGRKGRRAE